MKYKAPFLDPHPEEECPHILRRSLFRISAVLQNLLTPVAISHSNSTHFISHHVFFQGVAMHDSFQMQVSAKASFEKSSQEVALNCIAMEMFTEEGGHKQEQ